MEEKKIKERINKYNSDHFIMNTINEKGNGHKIISAREKNLLSLRKKKIDDEIMKNRMTSLINNNNNIKNDEKYTHLDLNLVDILQYLPEGIDEEFEEYDDKIEKIKEFLENYKKERERIKVDSIIMDNNINIATEAYMKFSIIKIRESKFIWENINDEGEFFDIDLLVQLLLILFETSDVKVQFEITQILINLTFHSKKFSNFLIEEQILTFLYKLAFSKEGGIVFHVIWILANLIDSQESCSIILTCIPNIIDRIIALLKEYSNIFIHQDMLLNLTWTIYRILICDEEYYIKFLPSIQSLIIIYEHEINNRVLMFDELVINSNNYEKFQELFFIKTRVENTVLTNILLILGKVTKNLEDAESFSIYFELNFVLTSMKVLNNALRIIKIEDLILLFRVLGNILTSPDNTHTDNMINYDFLKKTEKILEEILATNYYNSKLLKEVTWTLSNITAGTSPQVDYLMLNYKLSYYLIQISENFREPIFLKELIYFFYNAYSFGSDTVREKLLSDPILNLCIECISSVIFNKELVEITLNFFRLIIEFTKSLFDFSIYKTIKRNLEKKNITLHLEKLQFHENKAISDLATLILCDNWNLEDLYMLNH